jgi:hypothetical protein
MINSGTTGENALVTQAKACAFMPDTAVTVALYQRVALQYVGSNRLL